MICSFAGVDTGLKIPRGFDLRTGKLILQSHREISDSILKPYESRVYFWD